MYFVEVRSEKVPYVYEAPAGAIIAEQKLTVLEFWDVPILDKCAKVCISSF